MDWTDNVLARLAAATEWGYQAGAHSAAEPAALAALALGAHGLNGEARPALDWLVSIQTAEGSVGVTAEQDSPGWPTSLAVLAWRQAYDQGVAEFGPPTQRALDWLLRTRGNKQPQIDQLAHDSSLVGWPWVEGTHSWIEPTALAVLALKAADLESHPRTREAVRLLIDRLLPSGGCNYGNTIVLGQELRPHLQPTGLCLLALARGEDLAGSVAVFRALEFLQGELGVKTATASLCYGLMALAVHRRRPTYARQWLGAAAERTLVRDPSAHKLALLALALLDERSLPLLSQKQRATEVIECPIPGGARS